MTRFLIPAALLGTIAACDEAANQPVGLANPAATFCVESGGTYEIVDGAEGQSGICTLPDGTKKDAWEYFRENHAG